MAEGMGVGTREEGGQEMGGRAGESGDWGKRGDNCGIVIL